jgi:hypothetical protein
MVMLFQFLLCETMANNCKKTRVNKSHAAVCTKVNFESKWTSSRVEGKNKAWVTDLVNDNVRNEYM